MGEAAYIDFLAGKAQVASNEGFRPIWMPDFLFDFQAHLLDWSIWKGRAVLLEDCGLGKTPQELVWAENVVRHTNGRVLVLTFCTVAVQFVREAEKFGIQVTRSRDGRAHGGITIANYEQLHLFNPDDFVGVVLDEASIVKSFSGKTRRAVTEFMRRMRFRLAGTATAAPNDYIELGTLSEAMGYLGHVDMLNRFFKNDLSNSAQGRNHGETIRWRLKGHAETPFWRWVCSWARAVRKPSDLGFEDRDFKLPELIQREHLVHSRTKAEGMLFALPAVGLVEQREERRRTLQERCEFAAGLVQGTGHPFIVWADLNDEGDMLERLLPDCVQVSGKDSDGAKEEKLLAFIDGQVRGLVTKDSIGAWGLNFQHCAHEVGFPTNSYERAYQRLRRTYRFGQKRQVISDTVTTEGGLEVLKNQRRKAAQADAMFERLVAEMNHAIGVERAVTHTKQMEAPAWL